jgi:hypothetical protein
MIHFQYDCKLCMFVSYRSEKEHAKMEDQQYTAVCHWRWWRSLYILYIIIKQCCMVRDLLICVSFLDSVYYQKFLLHFKRMWNSVKKKSWKFKFVYFTWYSGFIQINDQSTDIRPGWCGWTSFNNFFVTWNLVWWKSKWRMLGEEDRR